MIFSQAGPQFKPQSFILCREGLQYLDVFFFGNGLWGSESEETDSGVSSMSGFRIGSFDPKDA
jgi:hypothetical protein